MPAKRPAVVPANASAYATPALEKGLDILELLSRDADGLTKTEIARSLSRTIPEIFRMLLCLEQRGYIVRRDGDRYTLALKMYRLAHEHPPTERLMAEALPEMHRVAQATEQSCHLALLEDGLVVILAQVNAPTSTGFYVKTGATVDLMEAASGHVILAFLPDAMREQAIASWQKRTGKSLPSDLQSHLTRIRNKGFEERSSYQVRGVRNISFPVFNAAGQTLAALTTPYIERVDARVDIAGVREAMRTCCATISREMGYFPKK